MEQVSTLYHYAPTTTGGAATIAARYTFTTTASVYTECVMMLCNIMYCSYDYNAYLLADLMMYNPVANANGAVVHLQGE